MADEPNKPAVAVEDLGSAVRVTPPADKTAQDQANAASAGNLGEQTEEQKQKAAQDALDGKEAGKPQGLPEGYDTLEAFVAAVNDGSYKPAEGKAKEGEVTPPAGEAEAGGIEADAAFIEKAAPFTEELQTTGALSDESVAKAAKEFNVPEAAVRQYVAGLSASAAAEQAPFFEVAGGAEQYSNWQKWADTGLTEAEMSAYNKALDSEPDVAQMLLTSFVDRWKADGGGTAAVDLTRLNQQGGGEGGDQYDNWNQVKAAMNDPKYKSDAEYRAGVEAKLGRSTNI